MTAWYVVRPLSDRAGFTGSVDRGSRYPFKASWPLTERLLHDELAALAAERVVLELDVREQDIRVDGTLRASAAPQSTPGVRLAFESPDGPMVFATDRFGWHYAGGGFSRDGWQQNARAIALGLEALRKVDRYGITNRREQYRGFRALPPGQGVAPSGLDLNTALKIIARESGGADSSLAAAVRLARVHAHPDRNHGDRSRWDAVDAAEQLLRGLGKL